MLLYIGFFVFIMIMAIDYEFNKTHNIYMLCFIAIALALLAGLRNPEIEKDYGQYLFSFDMIYADKNPLYLAIYEPGFFLIVYSVRSIFQFNYGMVIMLVYAFSSIFLKLFSIRSLAVNPYLVMLFYFSHFFFLHEMTQVRIGLATAIFFVSLTYYFKGNIKAYIGLIILATLFHYTAILYLGLLFFQKQSFNRYLYTGIILISIVLVFFKVPLIGYVSNFSSNEFTAKIENHAIASEYASEKINVLNVVTICNILCCLYLIFAVLPAEFLRDKKLTLFLKCNVLSIFLLSFLSGIPTIAFRVSDLFGILSMFSFAYLARYLPFGKYNIFITIIIAGTFFYFFALNGTLVKPYKMVDIK
jgi:EpsG family